MTSSAQCSFCMNIAYHFKYNQPRKDPNNINDGYWFCQTHLVEFEDRLKEKCIVFDDPLPPPGVSRAQRRAMKKQKRKIKL